MLLVCIKLSFAKFKTSFTDFTYAECFNPKYVPSGRRLVVPFCRTSLRLSSFIPSCILLYNSLWFSCFFSVDFILSKFALILYFYEPRMSFVFFLKFLCYFTLWIRQPCRPLIVYLFFDFHYPKYTIILFFYSILMFLWLIMAYYVFVASCGLCSFMFMAY